MDDDLHDLASALGARGGRPGTGASKRRGDSEYYRQLVSRRKDRRDRGTGMNHRHLQHEEFTSAAIDDVISNGGRSAWERLRREVLRDALVREKVLRVCAANASDPSAQRHRFWLHYARQKTLS